MGVRTFQKNEPVSNRLQMAHSAMVVFGRGGHLHCRQLHLFGHGKRKQARGTHVQAH